MSKRAKQRALEAVPPRYRKSKDGTTKIDSALPVRKFYTRAYEQAEKDFAELLKERIKTWESIYDENEQFGIDNEQANAVLEELKALLEEVEK